MNYDHDGSLNGRANEGKPWRLEDDQFICAYHSVGFGLIGPRDLGRSPESTKARWEFLKATGAEKAIRAMRGPKDDPARSKALAKYYDCIGEGA
jgi:hypothetical protein